MAKEVFHHPMIYTGPKESKDVSSLFQGGRRIVFALGPLSEVDGPLKGQKYADVTEAQGRRLLAVGKHVDPETGKEGPLFVWPEGTVLGPQTVTREEFEALADRLEAAEAKLVDLAAKLEAPATVGKKAAKDAAKLEAPATVPPAADEVPPPPGAAPQVEG